MATCFLGVSNNYVDSKQFPNRSGLFPRSKTPTADLGRTRPRLRDTLPERPKTPLLDSVGQVNGHMYNDDIPNSIQQMYPYMSEKQQINPTELGPTNEPGFPANDLSQIPTIRFINYFVYKEFLKLLTFNCNNCLIKTGNGLK